MITHSVFVILPITNAKRASYIFHENIEPVLNHYGFRAIRVDHLAISGSIIDSIHRYIEDSYFVVADLSYERPNCYYEIGYARGINKPVLLINESNQPIHFDLSSSMVHEFNQHRSLESTLLSIIPKFLQTPARDPSDTLNGKYGRQCIKDGYRLMAEVSFCNKSKCELNFEVCSIETTSPLSGKVQFFMHSSYDMTLQSINVKDGCARKISVSASGPWTLAAKVVESDVVLELDLATIPGAQSWWYRNAYKLVDAQSNI